MRFFSWWRPQPCNWRFPRPPQSGAQVWIIKKKWNLIFYDPNAVVWIRYQNYLLREGCQKKSVLLPNTQGGGVTPNQTLFLKERFFRVSREVWQINHTFPHFFCETFPYTGWFFSHKMFSHMIRLPKLPIGGSVYIELNAIQWQNWNLF